MIGGIRRQLINLAIARGRADIAGILTQVQPGSPNAARRVGAALDALRVAQKPAPLIGDELERWLPARLCKVLGVAGIKTLADLTVRVPRRRRWWVVIPGPSVAGARQVEAFFALHPDFTERARALMASHAAQELLPWERMVVPEEADGSAGAFRAPKASCSLAASNDYEAVHAWLSLDEASSTQRAYRKEAERLILWAIVERGKALSSLTTEDAIQYRAFLRRPTPRARWGGPPCSRTSPDWRPFTGELSARTAAYALSVLGAMFRWLIEQRYVLANPFAGIKVRGTRPGAMDTGRAFSDGEWSLLRTVADGLEWSYHWEEAAAQRLRFVLDFAYATGLRAEELVSAKLGQIEVDDHGDQWLKVVGKGAKAGKVALPPMAREALDRYLVERGLPVTPEKWKPGTPVVGNLNDEGAITATRLWSIFKRVFATAAIVVDERSPATADKLRWATPHWMRHTHATYALDGGAELKSVRDNLRHASIATTSVFRSFCTATMCGGRSRWQGCSACERSSALACWSRYTRSGVTVYNEMCRPLPRRLDDRIQRSLVGAEAHQSARKVRLPLNRRSRHSEGVASIRPLGPPGQDGPAGPRSSGQRPQWHPPQHDPDGLVEAAGPACTGTGV